MLLYLDDLQDFTKSVIAETAILYTEAEVKGNEKEREHYFMLFNVYTGILKNIKEMRELFLPFYSLASTANNMFLKGKLSFTDELSKLEFEDKVSKLQDFIESMEDTIKKAKTKIEIENLKDSLFGSKDEDIEN